MARTLTTPSHLTLKDGVFYYRRVLPGSARRQVAVSLRTCSFLEARSLASVLDRTFALAVEQVRMTQPLSPPPDIAAIVRDYLRDELARQMRLGSEPDGGVPLSRYPLSVLEEHISVYRDEIAQRDPNRVGSTVNRLMERHSLPQARRWEVGMGVLEADLAVYEDAAARARGGVSLVLEPAEAPAQVHVAVPALPVAAAPGASEAPCKPLLSALVDPFFEHRAKVDGTRAQVMAQEHSTLTRFMEARGNRPVNTYGRGDLTGFLDTMRKMPSSYGRSPKDKSRSLEELIARAEVTKAKRLTEKTLKRHLSALSTFFQYVVDHDHITVTDHTNMLGRHRLKAGAPARAQRDAWTSEELTTLFKSPVWHGRHLTQVTKPGPYIIKDSRFWLPILALFHGGRLEEFADLYRRDVGCDDGTWFLDIVETEADEEAGKAARTLKNDNATRALPLHPMLIRLGFLRYVTEIAPNTDDPLFPDLAPQGKDRKRGPRFTRTFGYYRQKVGVYRPGVAMHAFRHVANTRLRDIIRDGQQARHVEFLMGHSGGGGEGSTRYDKGPGLKEVAATLALLVFPEVDLSHLYVDDTNT